jgi:phage shock protein PspC (stress-responsive transcriptional regulator)
MKKIININLSGRVIPIEDTAYESLQRYIESLRRYFANEEGRDEIINDIESRIAELFDTELKKGASCITDTEVAAVVNSIGRPEDFDMEDVNIGTAKEEETASAYTAQQGFHSTTTKRLYRDENNKVLGGVCSGLASYFGVDPILVRVIFIVTLGISFVPYLILWIAVPSTAASVIGGRRKKLYRDPEDKVLGGVCSGIGHYFGINAWIPRILFLLPFVSFAFRWGNWDYYDFSFPHFLSISFSPGALIIYIILWLVVPEAATTAEKLEMKGEKIDLNSIKNSVVEEMKGFQQRAGKFGKEAQAFAKEKSGTMRDDVVSATRRSRGAFGNAIVFIVKMILYFTIGCFIITLLVALFGIAITAIGLFPLKDYVLEGPWQNVFAWGTLILFIGVPIIGIITWGVRRLARVKTKNRMMRLSFLSLWFVGVFCLFGLVVSVGKNFRSSNTVTEEELPLVRPGVNRLEITSTASPLRRFYRDRWFRIEPFGELFEDTAYVKNITIQIIKSNNDSFKVTLTKLVNGSSRQAADALARKMIFNVRQEDSILIADKGIPITKRDKFRNQQVILTVYVPVGKQIRIDHSIGWRDWVRVGGPWERDDYFRYFDDNNVEEGWESDVDYIMQADGLYTLDGKPADNWKHRDQNNSRNKNIKDSLRIKQLQRELKQIEERHKKDSVRKINNDDNSDENGSEDESTTKTRVKAHQSTTYAFCPFSPLII